MRIKNSIALNVFLFNFVILFYGIASNASNTTTLQQYKLGSLSYLFNTADEKLKNDISALNAELKLDKNTLKTLKKLAIYESEKIVRLKSLNYKWRRTNNKETLSSEKTKSAEKLHKEVKSLRNDISKRIVEALGNNKYIDFLLWVDKWWQDEINYRNRKIKNVYNTDQLKT